METLEKLFGSAARVKIMRLFIYNPEAVYDPRGVATKSNVKIETVRRELRALEKARLAKRKVVTYKGAKINGWTLDLGFQYLKPLQELLTHMGPLTHQEIIKRLGKTGRIKLIVVSGVFSQQWDGRVDMLIVGDRINRTLLSKTLRTLEAEIGKDLQYAALETPDFQYRMGIGDKLIRDVFDYPHEVVMDKLGLSH
jgi:hypothetical protein